MYFDLKCVIFEQFSIIINLFRIANKLVFITFGDYCNRVPKEMQIKTKEEILIIVQNTKYLGTTVVY